MDVLGKLSFLDLPDVNSDNVLIADTGVVSFSADVTANRPTAGIIGRMFLDTTTNRLYYDNGSVWVDTTQVPLIDGTANQITVVDGTNVTPTIVSIADNPVIPGTAAMRLPGGTTAERPATPAAGDIRYNSTLGYNEKYTGTYWGPFGLVLQQVTGTISASSGTGTIPYDNTVPLSTEGNQIWSQSFTPLSATSRVLIQFTITAASSITAGIITCAVFTGTTIRSATSNRAAPTAGQPINLSMNTLWLPGSTATVTISARLGTSAASTTYCNQGSAATLGGAYVSAYVITEIE